LVELLGSLGVPEPDLLFLLGDLRRTRLDPFEVHAYHLLRSAKSTRGPRGRAIRGCWGSAVVFVDLDPEVNRGSGTPFIR
jgi:hypothetical protein